MSSCAFSWWCECITTHLGEFFIYCTERPPIWPNEGELADGIFVDGKDWKPEWEDIHMTPATPTESGSDQPTYEDSTPTQNVLDFTSSVTDYIQEAVTTALARGTYVQQDTTELAEDHTSSATQEILRATTPILDELRESVGNSTEMARNLTTGLKEAAMNFTKGSGVSGFKETMTNLAKTKIQDFVGK